MVRLQPPLCKDFSCCLSCARSIARKDDVHAILTSLSVMGIFFAMQLPPPANPSPLASRDAAIHPCKFLWLSALSSPNVASEGTQILSEVVDRRLIDTWHICVPPALCYLLIEKTLSSLVVILPLVTNLRLSARRRN